MLPTYQIINTEISDQELVFALFEQSVNYQEKKGYPIWRNYDKKVLLKDIENKNQYKVVVNGKTGIVFSVGYADKIIWRNLDMGDSIYLHRIVVNQENKGHRLFGAIL